MTFRFQTLTLVCKKSTEIIPFSPHVSFFHGEISTGKSSIARLIDFCLGAHLDRTPALKKEFISAALSAIIGDYEVILERGNHSDASVRVTWKHRDGRAGSLAAPIQAASIPILDDHVFNLSDLLFHFQNITPMKVRRGYEDGESELVRLSFRDIMWYCYLEQDLLDSSFYRMEDTYKRLKSRYVMRFITGFYTQRMSDLELELDELDNERRAKRNAAREVKEFLQQFGFGTELDIQKEILSVRADLTEAQKSLDSLRIDSGPLGHMADRIRDELRDCSRRLDQERMAADDLREKIDGLESLHAELLASKFKLARATNAAQILDGIKFEACPQCGTHLRRQSGATNCNLCKEPAAAMSSGTSAEYEQASSDLFIRLEEISDSIRRHKESLEIQNRRISSLSEEKAVLDRRLDHELKAYDSAYLSRARNAERQVAKFEERASGLQRIAKMPEAVENLERAADKLELSAKETRRRIENEKKSITRAREIISAIESAYLQSLVAVRAPGVKLNDVVRVNTKSWLPEILESGEKDLAWNFYEGGSGGKKTLLNVCYALALHRVATAKQLPLPHFLIIDSPMKNISEDVNRTVFEGFYHHLYSLAEGELKGTQFIIIDNDYVSPQKYSLKAIDRYFSDTDDKFPPLIPYYRGA